MLGFGAAFLMPLSMAVLPVLFTPEERPKALTAWVTANALGIPLGPVIGGYLLDHYHWGAVFLINLPVVVIGLLAIAFLLPESKDPNPPRLQAIGLFTSSAGLVALTYGVIEKQWLLAGAGVLILAVFARVQKLIDPALFRSRAFTWGGHPRHARDLRHVRPAVRDAAVLRRRARG